MYKPKIKGFSDNTLLEYWNDFKLSAKIDKRKYNMKLTEIIAETRRLKDIITANKSFIEKTFDIKLDNYVKEWQFGVFNKSETMLNHLRKRKHLATSKVKTETYEMLIKYCNLLRQASYTNKIIKSISLRANINFREYLDYVRGYYNTVHKIMLEGNAYRYNHNIGTLVLNFWRKELKSSDERATLRFINFQATKKLKEQIIAEGKIPYNKVDAAVAKARGVPYEGVPYIVYNDKQSYLQLCLYDSQVLGRVRLIFNDGGAMYDPRFASYSTIEKQAQMLRSFDELVSLSADVKIKAKIMIEKYPESYMNLIRNPTMMKRYAEPYYR